MVEIKKILASLLTRERYAGVIDSMFLFEDVVEISGWACDLKRKDRHLQVEIYHGANLLGITDCNLFRIDLKELNYGNGYNGFKAEIDIRNHSVSNRSKFSVRIAGSDFCLQDKHTVTNLDKLLPDRDSSPYFTFISSSDQHLVTGSIKSTNGQPLPDSVKLVNRKGNLVGDCKVIENTFSITLTLPATEECTLEYYLLDSKDDKPLLTKPVYLENLLAGQGIVTSIEENQISGWAHVFTTRYLPATVLAFVEDDLVGNAKASKFRNDAFPRFSNMGFCGFIIKTTRTLSAIDKNNLKVRIAGTDCELEIPDSVRQSALNSVITSDDSVEPTPNQVGYLDQCSSQFMPGWAVNLAAPDTPVQVDIYIDDSYITTITPDVYRKDVNDKYSLKGNVGFNFEIPAGLSLSGEIKVCAKFHDSGEMLYNCPRTIRFGLPGVEIFPPLSQNAHQILDLEPTNMEVLHEPALAIIVLNRNGCGHLKSLFSSFHTHNTYKNYKFYLVDHRSTDDSEAVCREWMEMLNLVFIRRDRNYSFSESNNYVANFVGEELLLFLNNDIQFVSDIIPKAVAFFQNSDTGIVGIKLLNYLGDGFENNSVQHLGVRFDFTRSHRTFLPFEIMDLYKNSPVFETIHSPPSVTAAFMLARRKDFLEINGFDEGYFYGFEDIDFCMTFTNRLSKKIVCATELTALHKTSSTRRQLTGKEKRRASVNFRRLNERIGRHLIRSFRKTRSNSTASLTGKRFTLAFAVSGTSIDIPEGDFYTAYELGLELYNQFGWEIRYLAPDKWYRLKGFDAVVVMRHDYNPQMIAEQSPYLIKIAWMRNWFEGWIASDYVRDYDQIWCASAKAIDLLQDKTGAMVKPLYIATNHKYFSPGNESPAYKADYCFTGSFYRSPRQVFFDLDPDNIPYEFALFGSNWENIQKFKRYLRGHVPYPEMPAVYRSTKLVIDDANHTVKGWGSVNSRVFDALAAGALVVTNDTQASYELFEGLLPCYSNKEDLRNILFNYLENDALRSDLAASLRQKILLLHTYEQRARQVHEYVREYDSSAIRIGIVTHPEMIHAGMIARELLPMLKKQGFVVHRRTPGHADRNQSLGDDVIIFISDQHARTTLPYEPEPHQYNILIFSGCLDQISINTAQKLDEVIVINGKDNKPEISEQVTSIYFLSDQPVQETWKRDAYALPSASENHLLLETSLFCKRLLSFAPNHFNSLRGRLKENAFLMKSMNKNTRSAGGDTTKVTDDDLVYLRYFPANQNTSEFQKYFYSNFPYRFDINPGSIESAINNLKQSDQKTIFHLHAASGILGAGDSCNELNLHGIKSFLSKLDIFLGLDGIFIWSIQENFCEVKLHASGIKDLYQALFDRAHIAHLCQSELKDTLSGKFNINNEILLVTEQCFYNNESASISHDAARNHLGLPDDACIILINDDLNIDTCIKLIRHLMTLNTSLNREVCFVFAKQSDISVLKFLHEQSRMYPYIRYIPGHIPRDIQLKLFSASNFLLVPEMDSQSPENIIQAMSNGLPVIAPETNATANRRNINSPVMQFDSNNPQSMINSVRHACSLTEDGYGELRNRILNYTGQRAMNWASLASMMIDRIHDLYGN